MTTKCAPQENSLTAIFGLLFVSPSRGKISPSCSGQPQILPSWPYWALSQSQCWDHSCAPLHLAPVCFYTATFWPEGTGWRKGVLYKLLVLVMGLNWKKPAVLTTLGSWLPTTSHWHSPDCSWYPAPFCGLLLAVPTLPSCLKSGTCW